MGGEGKVDEPDEDAIMKQVMAESLKDSKPQDTVTTNQDKKADEN